MHQHGRDNLGMFVLDLCVANRYVQSAVAANGLLGL
jgi:hypothetical protein